MSPSKRNNHTLKNLPELHYLHLGIGGSHDPSSVQFEVAAPTILYPGIHENQTFEDIWNSSPFNNTTPLLFCQTRGSEHVSTALQEIRPEIQFHSPFDVHCTFLPPLVWVKPFSHATVMFVPYRWSTGPVALTKIDPGGRLIGSRHCILSQKSVLLWSHSPVGKHVPKFRRSFFSWNPSAQVMFIMEPANPVVEDAIPWSGLMLVVLQFLAEIGENQH